MPYKRKGVGASASFKLNYLCRKLNITVADILGTQDSGGNYSYDIELYGTIRNPLATYYLTCIHVCAFEWMFNSS